MAPAILTTDITSRAIRNRLLRRSAARAQARQELAVWMEERGVSNSDMLILLQYIGVVSQKDGTQLTLEEQEYARSILPGIDKAMGASCEQA